MMRHVESKIQSTCVTWFRLQYPSIGRLLFAIPNGGGRSKVEAAIMKGEGVTAGVSDMILLYPSAGFHALCIELKTEAKGSKQTPLQKEWQALSEYAGNKYVVCRSYDDFRREVKEYLFGFSAERSRVTATVKRSGNATTISSREIARLKDAAERKDELERLMEIPLPSAKRR